MVGSLGVGQLVAPAQALTIVNVPEAGVHSREVLGPLPTPDAATQTGSPCSGQETGPPFTFRDLLPNIGASLPVRLVGVSRMQPTYRWRRDPGTHGVPFCLPAPLKPRVGRAPPKPWAGVSTLMSRTAAR